MGTNANGVRREAPAFSPVSNRGSVQQSNGRVYEQ
jgi:hypothetical protein